MNQELERFDPAEQAGRISYEHLHRYALCREYVAGMRVLDMGCGTGYGSALLSGMAASVTAIDISDIAIRAARQRYGAVANLEYLPANCYELPFENDSFDAVVANEIIEHVYDHEAFVAEARRVLKPGGLFLVSTPNKPVYNRYKPPNVYHVSEMDIPEFRSLLRQHFSHVRLTGTRMALVSTSFVLDTPEKVETPASVTVYRGTTRSAVEQGIAKDGLQLGDPEYVLAVCSEREFNDPANSSSLYYSPADDLWLEHEKIMDWASGLHEEHEVLRADIARSGKSIQSLEKTIELSEENIQSLEKTIESLEKTIATVRADLSKPQRQFIKTHKAVRSQLADATTAMLSPIPAAQPRPRTWKQKLFGAAAPFHTAIFDREWIAKQVPGARRISLGAFISDPRYHTIDPHPLFSAREYLRRYPDVAATGMSPLLHYVRHGWRESRDPHGYFANDWYLYKNSDVVASGALNPLDHYLTYGWREGRRPNPVFHPRRYLDRYYDVARANLEPLTHYVMYGEAENRDPTGRSLDPDWRRFVPPSRRGATQMDYLLHDPVAELPINVIPFAQAAGGIQTAASDWPPLPLDDYCAPQLLHDFILDGYGEEAIDLYAYVLSVMETFRDRSDEFGDTDVCANIVSRIRSLAASREAEGSTPPDASIIIPVYNNILDTLLCLLTVLESDDKRTYEVIVADDCSSDATQKIISGIAGVVRYVRQPSNLGFLGNCNAAADQALGQHIVLLNNDTLVMPLWLDRLLAPFNDFKGVGLTGAKLINWDGTLQEAGGVFWKDGSAWNFGRGQDDARAPEFSYMHDVDYCSGAAIAIPAILWRKVAGFDPLFQPAYCEDSDLAFRLRAEGYRTVLAANCEVIHHEGRSHGRDLSSGIKSYQVANQQRLLKRWTRVLESENFPNGQNVLRARDRSRDKRHILIVDHYVPQWDRDAGSRTMRQFIDALVDDDWAVTLWPDNLFRDPDYTPALQAKGVEVIYGPRFAEGFSRFLKERKGLYDAVLLSRPHISQRYIADVRKLTSARIAYYGHDVHFQRMTAQRERGDKSVTPAAIKAQRRQELDVCSRSDTILYPSLEEAELMGSLVPAKVKAMPIAAYSFAKSLLDTSRAALAERATGQANVATLLFVGGFAHTPNVDGILWFCSEVMPLLREAGIRCKLLVAGSNAGTNIWALEAEDVEVLGFVSDEQLAKLYREAAVAVAPLRFGAGVKGKVVEAMANGVPVVTTTVGAQGLQNADRYLFIGDTPGELAEAVKSALDPTSGSPHAATALDYVEGHYSGEAVRTALRKAFGVSQ